MPGNISCGACGEDIDYIVMLNALNIRPCKKGCRSSIFIERDVLEDAIEDMNAKRESTKVLHA